MLPTDNAPVWWLHAFLLSGAPLPADPESLFAEIPHHFHKVARFQTLNQAGFHAAHILSAKNRDTNWQSWSRDELARRMLVNLHPCNVFLVAKEDWARNGGRSDIIVWVVDAYRQRYGATMERFLTDCDPDESIGGPVGDPEYSYAPSISLIEGIIQTNRPVIRQSLLGRGVSLEISVDGSRYLLPHDDLVAWAREHSAALDTVSWTNRGVYSWPRPSVAMLEFLRGHQLPS